VGDGKLGFNLSETMLLKMQEMEQLTAIVEAAGQSVVNDTQEALFFTSRPEMKFILGVNYDIGKLDSILTIPILVKRNLLNKVYKI
jgi:iron complex outermembrane receptor protein